jgi:hypothetical protein
LIHYYIASRYLTPHSLSLCTLSEPEEAAGAQFKAEDTSCVDEEEEEEENTTKKDNSTTVSV